MERVQEDTPDKGIRIDLEQTLRIWQEEGLSDKAITYLIRRIDLDFDPPGGHILYRRKTELLEDELNSSEYQAITASSGMFGHKYLAVIYGWESIKLSSPDKPKVDPLPPHHSIWVGIHPRIDWWYILNRPLLELNAENVGCSIYVECFDDQMVIGKPKYPQKVNSYNDYSIYLDAADLTRALHAELMYIAGKR